MVFTQANHVCGTLLWHEIRDVAGTEIRVHAKHLDYCRWWRRPLRMVYTAIDVSWQIWARRAQGYNAYTKLYSFYSATNSNLTVPRCRKGFKLTLNTDNSCSWKPVHKVQVFVSVVSYITCKWCEDDVWKVWRNWQPRILHSSPKTAPVTVYWKRDAQLALFSQ